MDEAPASRDESTAADLGVLGWALIGDPLAAALSALLGRAWAAVEPGMSIEQADALPPGFSSAAPWRVVRLGPPLDQRLWLFWDAEGAERAAGALFAGLQVDVPGLAPPQTVDGADFPADGVLLPFTGVTPGGAVPLVIGIEAPQAAKLAAQLVAAEVETTLDTDIEDAVPSATWAVPGVPIEDLEVEASVYVGGGVYRLSTLAALRPGSILPLATEVGEPAVIAINGRVIAFGEVMLTRDQTLAVRLTRVALGGEGRMAGPVWLQPAAKGKRRARGSDGPR